MNIFRPLYDKSFFSNDRLIVVGITNSQYNAIKKKLETNKRINNISFDKYKIIFEIAGTVKELCSEQILEKYIKSEPELELPINSTNRKYYYVSKTRVNQFLRVCNEILKSELILIGYIISENENK